MLPFLLVFAAIQSWAAYGCFSLARRSLGGFVGATLLSALGFFLVLPNLFSFFLFFQFLLLVAVALVCGLARARGRWFTVWGALGSVGLVLAIGLSDHHRWTELQTKYPVESLATRLAYEDRFAHAGADLPTAGAEQHVSADALQRLDDVYDDYESYRTRRRAQALRLVHASQVEQFVANEGFGVGRGMGPAMWMIELPPDQPSIEMPPSRRLLPGEESDPKSAESPPLPLAKGADQPRLLGLHTSALTNFAGPLAFGYVEDREHVVGFKSHQLQDTNPYYSAPDEQSWRTARVELVSLLKHERPMVYVSDRLPAMSELKDAPVRPLDDFETRGLAALRSGEEVAIESTAKYIRMFGAVRAAKPCLACHTVDHGALLGAFSYELRPSAAPPVPPQQPAAQEPPESAAVPQARATR